MKKTIFFLGIVLLISAGVYTIIRKFNKTEKEELTYVTIDINPSIQLALNELEEVVEVLPLNDDADILLSDLNLVGLSLESATNTVMDMATEIGYIDEFGENNEVSINVYSENNEIKEVIGNKIRKKTQEFLNNKKIYSTIKTSLITEELKEEAIKHEISTSKMLLVEKAFNLEDSINKDELAKLSIKSIQEKIKSSVKARQELKKQNKEQFKEFIKEQKENKLRENKNKRNEIINNIKNKNREVIENSDATNELHIIEDLIIQKKEEIKQRAINKRANIYENGDETVTNANE